MYIKMKHRVSLLMLVVAVMIVAFAVCSFAANEKFELTVESTDSTGASMPSGAIVKENDEITVNVKIDNNPGITGVVFRLEYDKTVIKPVSNEATFVKEFTTPHGKGNVDFQFGEGYVKYNFSTPNYIHTVEDTGLLFSIKFKVVGNTTETVDSSISISMGSVLDGNIEELESSVTNTSIKLHNKHVEKVTDAIPAKCYSKGWTEEIVCSVCDEILKEKTSTGYLPHDMVVTTPAEPATCMAPGKTEGKKCQNVGCTHELPSQVDPQKAHNYQSVDAKAPTCLEPGWSSYEKCINAGCTEKKNYVEKEALRHVGMITEFPEQPATTTATGLTAGKQCYNCQTWIQPREVIPMIVEESSSFPWVWVIVGISVVAVAAVVVVYFVVIKKKNYKDDMYDYDDEDDDE